mmetsp:Transcript_17259/g.46836  ORF Transcript_17259/g.46836 Transcript_17259/m.46836 type:complete len:305 (+) Transcript_17259:794-1708(+)
MLPVGRVGLGIPDLEASHPGNVRRVHDLTQDHWLWPAPQVVHPEEPVDKLARCVVGIELADPRHQQRPRDPAKEAQDIGVDPSSSGPILHEAKRAAKGLLIRNHAQDQVRDPEAVHTPDALLVHVLQHLVVLDHLLRVLSIGQRLCKSCKEEIYADAAHLQLDDGCVRIWNGDALSHLLMLVQLLGKRAEEVLSANIGWSDAERVDVAAWVHNAKPVGAQGRDLHVRRHLLLCQASLCTNRDHPLSDHLLDLFQHVLSPSHTFRSLGRELCLQIPLHLLTEGLVCLRGLLKRYRLGDAILHRGP